MPQMFKSTVVAEEVNLQHIHKISTYNPTKLFRNLGNRFRSNQEEFKKYEGIWRDGIQRFSRIKAVRRSFRI